MARRAVAALLLLEVAGLAGAMLLYRRMEGSQDFRYTMQKRFPSILEGVAGVSESWTESSELEDSTSNQTSSEGAHLQTQAQLKTDMDFPIFQFITKAMSGLESMA